MKPIEIKSYKYKIDNSVGNDINDIIREILNYGDFPEELLPSVIKSVRKGNYILSNLVCSIISKTNSMELYDYYKIKNMFSDYDLSLLMKENYPDPDIEKSLCESLYKYYKDNSQPLRTIIVNSFRNHGTKISYDILDVIDYEFEPLYHLRKIEIDNLSEEELSSPNQVLNITEFRAMKNFIEEIKKVKKEIYFRLESSKSEEYLNDEKDKEKKPDIAKFIIGEQIKHDEDIHYEFKEVKGKKPINSIKNTADEYVVAYLNNYSSGKIYWGIRDNDKKIVGVKLDHRERDNLRRVITDKLSQIKPAISPSAYKIELHPVYKDNEKIKDLWVIEILIKAPLNKSMYFTGGDEAFIKSDAGKKKLSGPELEDEIKRRSKNI